MKIRRKLESGLAVKVVSITVSIAKAKLDSLQTLSTLFRSKDITMCAASNLFENVPAFQLMNRVTNKRIAMFLINERRRSDGRSMSKGINVVPWHRIVENKHFHTVHELLTILSKFHSRVVIRN